MSSESIEQQRLFQERLDDEFPAGARVSHLETISGRLIPTMQLVVPRLFCTEARLGSEQEWYFEVVADPNVPGTDPTDMQHVWHFWIEGFVILDRYEHDLYESEMLASDGEEIPGEFVRALPDIGHLTLTDAEGNPVSLERMREWTTARWSEILRLEVV